MSSALSRFCVKFMLTVLTTTHFPVGKSVGIPLLLFHKLISIICSIEIQYQFKFQLCTKLTKMKVIITVRLE